ncbi:MAG TPA: magnesium transporter [Candidatus Babeliales bacterium]|jgi:magnesium transporter|nr:magnesium transporter [Candidatus Babeliales bacterium]
MDVRDLLYGIQENIDDVIAQKGLMGGRLWHELINTHPVDIAYIFKNLSHENVKALYKALPNPVQLDLFHNLQDKLKVYVLSFLDDQEQVEAFQTLSTDELTDLFDVFSDEELKRYLSSLNKRVHEKVKKMLKFEPESAAGVMHTDVITLMEDFTVEKSVSLMQRLRPSRDVHQQIFVVNKDHRLIGFVYLEDLVFNKPDVRISSFMHDNELVANANEDREKIAKEMVHYGLTTVPVIGTDDIFLGVISGDTLVDVLVEEAVEDVQKMAAMTPLTRPYFETSFFQSLYERSYILVILLLAGSVSTTIMRMYEATLTEMLLFFVPMLTSVGGNTSNQTSAVAICGMASGEFDQSTMKQFLRRELMMASCLSVILGVTSFTRVYLTTGVVWESLVVSFTLAIIVLVSVMLGSAMPFILKRFNIDPAFSAGPFLATIMDIVGILIYCTSIKMLLF